MIKVQFVVKPEEIAVVRRKLIGISAVDLNFVYKVVQLDDGNYLLIVYANSKDEAFKKGMWLRDKLFNNDRYFKVRD